MTLYEDIPGGVVFSRGFSIDRASKASYFTIQNSKGGVTINIVIE